MVVGLPSGASLTGSLLPKAPMEPRDATEKETAELLAKRFIARRDVKAEQQPDGAYYPIRSPWTMTDLYRHLRGDSTFGHYLLNEDDQVKLFAFDIDVDADHLDAYRNGDAAIRQQLREASLALALSVNEWITDEGEPVTPLISASGNKGVHVYGLFEQLTPATVARAIAHVLLQFNNFTAERGDHFWKSPHWPNVTIELFPKQDSLDGKDLGNLMRLPLGVNQKSGKRGMFLDVLSGEPKPHDPVTAMTKGSFDGDE